WTTRRKTHACRRTSRPSIGTTCLPRREPFSTMPGLVPTKRDIWKSTSARSLSGCGRCWKVTGSGV
ncbi:MAG: hypothetical protein AVDCRST_MAG26-2871, partial [uncultured Chloroflexia bacterium]